MITKTNPLNKKELSQDIDVRDLCPFELVDTYDIDLDYIINLNTSLYEDLQDDIFDRMIEDDGDLYHKWKLGLFDSSDIEVDPETIIEHYEEYIFQYVGENFTVEAA